MNAAIVKVTYDRKTKAKLSEEITDIRTGSENFDIQVVKMFLNRMLKENIVPKLNINAEID